MQNLPAKADFRGDRFESADFLRSGLSWGLAFLIGGSIAIVLTPALISSFSGAIYMWRAGTAVLFIAAIVSTRLNFSGGFRFINFFSIWFIAYLITVLFRFGDPATWLDLGRQVFLVLYGLVLYQMSSLTSGRIFIKRTMIVLLSLMSIICLFYAPQVFRGDLSWSNSRIFKGQVASEGVGFNTILPMMAILLIALAGDGNSARRPFWLINFGIFLLSAFLFAARAPLLAAVTAYVVSLSLSAIAIRSQRGFDRRGSMMIAFGMMSIPLGLLAIVLFNPSSTVNVLLAGRLALWQIGTEIWLDNPLIGVGPNALAEGVRNGLGSGGFTFAYERDSLAQLTGGGYHNLWLDNLISKGAVGFLGLFFMFFLLLTEAIKGLGRSGSSALWFMTFMVLLFSRSFVEVSGLGGYGNSPFDFIVVMVLAWFLAMNNNLAKR